MTKITCSPRAALDVLLICNYYADNDCHKSICDDTARRMIKTVIKHTRVNANGATVITVHEEDREVLRQLLAEYVDTYAAMYYEMIDIIGSLT